MVCLTSPRRWLASLGDIEDPHLLSNHDQNSLLPSPWPSSVIFSGECPVRPTFLPSWVEVFSQAVQINIHCPVPSGLNLSDQLMSLSKATTISSSDWLFSLKHRSYSGPSMSTVLHTKPVSASNGAPPATTLFPDPGSSQLDCGLWSFPCLGSAVESSGFASMIWAWYHVSVVSFSVLCYLQRIVGWTG